MEQLFSVYYRIIFLFILALCVQSVYTRDHECDNLSNTTLKASGNVDYNNIQVYQIYDSLGQEHFKAGTPEGEIRLVKEINGIKIYQYVATGSMEISDDSVFSVPDSDLSGAYPNQNKKTPTDDFDILEHSPYNELNPIPSNISLPGGLIFRIQLGVFSRPVSNDNFRGLFPVSYEEIKSNVKYYTGIFNSSEKANKTLKAVREYGFPDSFIVPFYDGRRISIEKAKEIEYSQIKL